MKDNQESGKDNQPNPTLKKESVPDKSKQDETRTIGNTDTQNTLNKLNPVK